MRERRSSKGRIIVFLVIVGIMAYLYRDSIFAPNPALQNTTQQVQPSSRQVVNQQVPVQQTVIVTRLTVIDVEVTQTPYPTATPYPTYTPQPTPAPIIIVPTPIVINVSGDYGPDGKYDQIASLWLPRILAFLILLFTPIVGGYTIYRLRSEQQRMIHKEEMAKLEIERIDKTPSKRSVVVNTPRTKTDDGMVKTANGTSISKEKVFEFILNVKEVGLSINRWKESSLPLHQGDIETILDHLEELGVISERTSGISATWKREVDMLRLARYMGVTQEELSTYEKDKARDEEKEEDLLEDN